MLSRRAPAAGSRSAFLAQALRQACELDLLALKPGNVGFHGDGHGMSTDDFTASADAIAAPLAAAALTVGRRILAAVEATRAVVPCNTNLGIVLLCAPLAQAALDARPGDTLAAALERVLAGLDVEDARRAYAAIRLANPGGLGSSPRHDVREPPGVTLLDAMREASDRDSIARQYASGFADIFECGLPVLRRQRARGRAEAWAVTALYVDYLARLPDSHILRKHGAGVAGRTSAQAAALAGRLASCDDPRLMEKDLLDWDRQLKAAGVNPGTSADLTVATLLAARIEDWMGNEFTAARPASGVRGNAMWGKEEIRTPSMPTN